MKEIEFFIDKIMRTLGRTYPPLKFLNEGDDKMKKKIIFVAFCLILFLIFTALGYAWGPKAERLRADPHQELRSPPSGDQFDDVLLVIIPNWNGFTLVVCAKKDSPKENPALQSSTTQEVKSKTNNNVKRAR